MDNFMVMPYEELMTCTFKTNKPRTIPPPLSKADIEPVPEPNPMGWDYGKIFKW